MSRAAIAQGIGAAPTVLLHNDLEPPEKLEMRTATVTRTTAETEITASVDLDGTGRSTIATGIGFLDHMLDQIARHGLIDITLGAKGDLDVDGHHTTEDSAIVLGQAVARALGDRAGICRFGEALSAMDETLVRVVVDVSGRPYVIWKVAFTQARLGMLDTELIGHWFHTFGVHAGLTLHVEALYGTNNHHLAEACFKGFARALRAAIEIDPRRGATVPSTKGTLGATS